MALFARSDWILSSAAYRRGIVSTSPTIPHQRHIECDFAKSPWFSMYRFSFRLGAEIVAIRSGGEVSGLLDFCRTDRSAWDGLVAAASCLPSAERRAEQALRSCVCADCLFHG